MNSNDYNDSIIGLMIMMIVIDDDVDYNGFNTTVI